MFLPTHLAGFSDQAAEIVVEVFIGREAEHVHVVARRVGVDSLETGRPATPREDEVPPQRRFLGHQGGESHSHLERNPRSLRDDGERSGGAGDLDESVEQAADDRIAAGEERVDVEHPARMLLVPRREPRAAPGTAPEGPPRVALFCA